MNSEATAWDFVRRAGRTGPPRTAVAAPASTLAEEPYLTAAQIGERFSLPEAAILSLAKAGRVRHLCIGRNRQRFFRYSHVKADLQALELASLCL